MAHNRTKASLVFQFLPLADAPLLPLKQPLCCTDQPPNIKLEAALTGIIQTGEA